MAARLKLILGRTPWSLVLRPVFLSLVWLTGPAWLTVLFAVVFFLRSGSKPGRLLISASILTGLSVFPVWHAFQAPYAGQLSWLFVACFAVCWFLIFAIKELLFIDRAQVLNVLQAIIFFLGTWLFYWQFDMDITSFYGAVFLGGCFFLFFDFFSFVVLRPKPEAWLFAVASLLLFTELFFVASILPLGFLNGTALLFLIFCVYEYACLDYFSLKLSLKRSIFNAGLLLVGMTLIAVSSNWKI